MLGEYSWDFWILFGLSEKDLVFCEIMEMLNISGIFHNKKNRKNIGNVKYM